MRRAAPDSDDAMILPPARDRLKQWATVLPPYPGQPEELRRFYIAERISNGNGATPFRMHMARLEFPLYVTTLVHYQSEAISTVKLEIIRQLTAMPCSRREYWNRLERAHYFAAGMLSGAPGQ